MHAVVLTSHIPPSIHAGGDSASVQVHMQVKDVFMRLVHACLVQQYQGKTYSCTFEPGERTPQLI